MVDWGTLYQNEAPKLIGVCRRYVGNTSVAEDIVHDSFLAAIEKMNQFKGKGSVEAWVYRITLNSALQYLKNNKPFLVAMENAAGESDEKTAEEDDRTARGAIENADFSRNDLLEAMDQLPEHHRVVFNLYVMEEYKHKDIAKMLGISAGTSKSHLARARKKLIQILSLKAEEKENQQRRRKVSALWFFPFSDLFVDQLYREKFRNFTVAPQKTFTAPNSGVSFSRGFSLLKNPFTYVVTTGVVGVSLFFALNSKSPGLADAESVVIENEIETELPEKAAFEESPENEGIAAFEQAETETESDTIRRIVRKPVYIRKTIVVRDTIR
ncbi:RNA polymerase sigma factor, sigma-70 family [Mariniphaga anaerophila]|uniref:RNA polymerase sigma factor, sigma-70 family n=1 Tax=Mariniphaga anaerophila TaxID=1484053 RepID=A0A1M4YSD5_9BACT|nr:RNA polymerase sigma factor, sigma-70 family [Mariniphaga anaerophila]